MTGARLDDQSRAILDKIAQDPFLDPAMPLERLRANFAAFHRSVELPRVELDKVENRAIAGPRGDIAIRIYRAKSAVTAPRPLLVYYHGGGMIFGNLDTHDAICRRLAEQSAAIVVAVDYALAPENRFPAAVDDAYAALLWAYDNGASVGGDPARLAVGGDSAGGNLAAVVAQLARDRNGPPLRFQLLIYPAVGMKGESQSMEEFAQGYFFERAALDWFFDQYLVDRSQIGDPRVSPILSCDFSRLPPAFMVTAGFDILRDDGEAYIQLLRDAGVAAEHHRYETTIHGFISMAGAIDAGQTAIDECAEKLRTALEATAGTSKPYEVFFENEFVRLVNVNIARGEIVPEFVPGSNRMVGIDFTDSGRAYYLDGSLPEQACERNDKAIREIRVELKSAPRVEPHALDAIRLEPARFRVEFENEHVRIVRLRFGAHEKGIMVHHPPRVLATITDVAVKLKFADGRSDERGAPATVAAWLDAETLQTENAADAPLEVVLVEPK
ncbi:MAG TPA: alpha/beta hydrolase [Candidatus Binataceae bacterium]|nr:alpha/beta hydrolase [Candidatus Binataceae bacterium]